MRRWRSTAALSRGLAVAALGLVLAVVFGEPVLVVLVAPLMLCAAFAMVHRPTREPQLSTELAHRTLHEGQGTTCHLHLTDADDAEQVTRVTGIAPYVALRPASGVVGALLGPNAEVPSIAASPRRWGPVRLGEETVGLTSRWAGFRWGPETMVGLPIIALPTTAPFDSRAEVPAPLGLVGAHRSRRIGGGTEFSGIRQFAAGDRLRRINWRVSLRAGDLHVVDTRAEEDAGVLLVVDALAELGRSGGVDGDPSSLDVTVRAAAALAEHHIRAGDRVGLRVVGGGDEFVTYAAGRRQLRIILGTLAHLRPGHQGAFPREGPTLRTTAGTVVMVLSPMLEEGMVNAAAQLTRRGLATLVIDTLPETLEPGVGDGPDPVITALAWRMRRSERDLLLEQLAGTGCPVVRWRGPGTVDEVLHRLARRAQLPQVRAR